MIQGSLDKFQLSPSFVNINSLLANGKFGKLFKFMFKKSKFTADLVLSSALHMLAPRILNNVLIVVQFSPMVVEFKGSTFSSGTFINVNNNRGVVRNT